MIAGETAIFLSFWLTGISFLWYNVIGCITVIVAGALVSKATGGRAIDGATGN